MNARKMISWAGAASLLLGVGGVAAPSFAAESHEKHAAKQEAKADCTLELTGKSVAAGVGYSWGSGSLLCKGKRYPISVDGLSVGSVGASMSSATGKVYHLSKISDFDGTYAAVGAGATVGGGASIATMKNQNGVVIDMDATTTGLKFDVAASGVKLNIKDRAASR